MRQESMHGLERVDAKTAEEALALAIRLQQEGGERVSLEQLQKTADEAGIEREYLEEALKRVRGEAVAKAPDSLCAARPRLAAVAGGLGAAIAAIATITTTGRYSGLPPAMFAGVVCGIALAFVVVCIRKRP